MTTSATQLVTLHMTLEVPAQLSNKAINQAVQMLASRGKFLLGQSYREQIQKRVSVRKPSRQPEPVS